MKYSKAFPGIWLGSHVDDVGGAKMDGFRRSPIVRDGPLYDRERAISTDRFGETHELLSLCQHGFDYLPDRAAAALIGQSDSFRSLGRKFFNACLKVAEELGEKVGERIGYRVRFDDAVSMRWQ